MSSVKTNIRTALKTCLQEITIAGGYNNTITDVFDPPLNMEKMINYPTVNILYGSEQRRGDRYRVGNNPLFDIMLPVQFDCFLYDMNDTQLAQDKILSDIQKYFGFNYYLKPAGGERTLFEMIWLGDTQWGTEVEIPNCGISIDFELYYSIRVNNPDQMI